MRMSRGAGVAAVMLLTLLGCGTTRQARDVGSPGSGFLGDYSRLRPAPDNGALLAYENPAANLKTYDKIILEPLTLWMTKGSQLNELAKPDRARVADRFYQLVHTRLEKDYRMVRTTEPGTLRIAVALTSAEASSPTLDTISTILPVGLAVSSLKAIATGKPAYVGEATAEMKISDANTGEILFEAVDRRLGTKNPSGLLDQWQDVDDALAYWANRTGYRLCVERGASGCVAP